MLRFEGVRFAYPGGPEVLRGLDLTLRPGDRVVLAGASGGGKSTLLALAAGLYEPTGGRILHDGSQESAPVGLVQQSPENQLLAATVEGEVAFGLENLGLPTVEIRRRVDEALALTGLAALRRRAPSDLSGGEMQRLAFAAAYAMRPALWLLDEPASYLDPDARGELYALLASLPEESILLYVASSPEEYTLTGRLALLAEGRIAAVGEAGRLIEDGSLARAGLAVPRLTRLRRRLEESPPTVMGGKKTSGPVRSSAPVSTGDAAGCTVTVRGLHAARRPLFGEEREVLHGLDLELRPGEVTALVGPSGAGKSTLLEVLAGLLAPSSGEVLWDGAPPERLRGRIGIAFQFPERSFFAETLLAEVAYGPRNLGLSGAEAGERARQALSALRLDPVRDGERNPFDLSGGEARRAALASVAALRPDAYLLDEPTAGLDEASAGAVGELIRREAERGCVILVAGHDVDRFADWATRWILLRDGVLLRDGGLSDWWGDPAADPWPAPAVVRAWREAGLPVETLQSLRVDALFSGEGG